MSVKVREVSAKGEGRVSGYKSGTLAESHVSSDQFLLLFCCHALLVTLDAQPFEMVKIDIELGETLLIHRKSQVHLLTSTTSTVSCKAACPPASAPSSSDGTLQPCRLWLPRARAFRLCLQLYFADDLD